MSGFIAGEARFQATLFPEELDDYIAEDNAVRVIDIFVDEIDLTKQGFKTIPANTGRPAYHPATMLKLFIYGYFNRVQSSRRLEREAGRNVELMWLLGRLAPDFKTIADFRKDNTKAIQSVCRQFVLLCRKLDLFSDALIAIDGSKFKAVNNRDLNFTQAKLKYRLKLIDESIAKYLLQIESADRQEVIVAKVRTERLESKIARLKEEVARLNAIEKKLINAPDKQLSLTDPDARSMKTRGTGIVGYNVQTAGIKTFLPKVQTSGNQAKGYFGKRDFIYKPEVDEYECPAGKRAIYRFSREEGGKNIRRYWASECIDCTIKSQCTSGKNRRISRWEHETVLDALETRLDSEPDMMRLRRSTVEHPFGTIKSWMGSTHFQMKTLKRVSAEMSLHVLAYNMKRVINLLGARQLIEAIQA